MIQTLLNNAQLLIVVAFVLLSLLGGLFRKIQEQREVQRRKAAAERARLEMLRTGRGAGGAARGSPVVEPVMQSARTPLGPPTSAAEALARLEEIARRRQEQLGKSRAQGQRRPAETVGPVIVMGPSGPIVLRPGQSPQAGMPAQRKGGKPGRQQQQPQRQKQGKQQARPTPPPPAPEPEYVVEQVRAAPAAPSNTPRVAPRPTAALPGGSPTTPEEWRRLAAATAIFGRPIGEQTPGDGPPRLF